MEEYTKYEHARIIGARALQISMGAPFMIKLNEEDLKKIGYNPIEIAKLEFEKGLIPISVKRHMPTAMKGVASAKPFDQTKLAQQLGISSKQKHHQTQQEMQQWHQVVGR